MKRVIAITGATGFAGRHAVTEILARGHRLRTLARDPARAALPGRVEIVAGALDDAGALKLLLDGADTVVHLAGALSAAGAAGYFQVNEAGTKALAEAARQAGIKRFIHMSSLAAREPSLSYYAASKRAGEDAVQAMPGRISTLVLRPPAVYGPNDRATLPLFRELTRRFAVIPGTPSGRFSLIHVSDLAKIIAEAASNEATGIVEVSDGKAGGYGWPELVKIAEIERGGAIGVIYLPRPIPMMAAGISEVIARVRGKPGMINLGKIAELYHPNWVSAGSGWKLTKPIKFAAGFPQTLAWYRSEGWLPAASRIDKSPAKRNQETG